MLEREKDDAETIEIGDVVRLKDPHTNTDDGNVYTHGFVVEILSRESASGKTRNISLHLFNPRSETVFTHGTRLEFVDHHVREIDAIVQKAGEGYMLRDNGVKEYGSEQEFLKSLPRDQSKMVELVSAELDALKEVEVIESYSVLTHSYENDGNTVVRVIGEKEALETAVSLAEEHGWTPDEDGIVPAGGDKHDVILVPDITP